MSLVNKFSIQEVDCFNLGYSLFGKPLISVFCYFVDGVLIDTAMRKMQKQIISLLKNKSLDKILLTHHHEDHSGNAQILKNIHQTEVYAGKETIREIKEGFKIKPYQQYMFGNIDLVDEAILFPEVIESSTYQFTPIFTPGHSPDHYVFLEKERGWLFSGDLYIGKIKIMRRDEDIGQMIDSIKTVLQHDFELLFCGHNPRFTKGKKYMSEKLQYLEDFYGKAAQLYHQGLSLKAILKTLQLKDRLISKIWTFNDLGADFMVRSVIKNEALQSN